jgi:urea transport system substrate-binding protein
MRFSSRSFVLFVVAGLVAVLAGCGGGDSGASSKAPAKIGVLLQLSGAAGVYGPPSRQAAELAAQEINAKGGVLGGRKVQVVVADDATDVKTAGEQAQTLLLRDKVDGIISTEGSAARDAVLPVVRRAKSMMIYTPLYEGKACDQRLFNLGEVPQQQVSPVVPYLQDRFGGKQWFVVGDDYIWPRQLGQVTRSVVTQAGGSVAGEQFVPLGTTDFSSVIQKVRSSGANVVMMALVGSDAVAFVKQMASFGLNDKVKTFGLAMLDNTLPAAKGSADGLIAAYGYFDALDTPSNKKFLADLRAKYGQDAALQTTLSESTYEGVHLWAEAVDKAGSTDPDKVITAMGGQSFDGPRGNVTVDGSNRHVAQHVYVGEAQPDGTYKIIKDFGVVQPGPQCAL